MYVNLYEIIAWIVHLCGSVAVCGSAAVCSISASGSYICGSAHSSVRSVRAIVCSSAIGSV
jgi:hypothetical protein